MEEARKVMERLERIERLREAGAVGTALLAEVRSLLVEGEAWLAAEAGGTDAARVALGRCRSVVDAHREEWPRSG